MYQVNNGCPLLSLKAEIIVETFAESHHLLECRRVAFLVKET